MGLGEESILLWKNTTRPLTQKRQLCVWKEILILFFWKWNLHILPLEDDVPLPEKKLPLLPPLELSQEEDANSCDV